MAVGVGKMKEVIVIIMIKEKGGPYLESKLFKVTCELLKIIISSYSPVHRVRGLSAGLLVYSII